MLTSSHLPTLSLPLVTDNIATDYSMISSVLTLLGWQDKSSTVMQANEAERLLQDNLQAAYTDYLAFPSPSSIDNLNTNLTAVIEKLEKNRATATRLARKADERLNDLTQNYVHNRIMDFIEGMTAQFKAFLANDIASKAHYEQLVIKYDAQLQALFDFQQQILLEKNTIEYRKNQRRLLQTSNASLPLTTKQFCYPNGDCDLKTVSNGFSGLMVQGESAGDNSGYATGAGDINGDGIPDIIIGAPYAAPSVKTDAGETYVIFGAQNITMWGSGVFNLTSLANGKSGFVVQGELAGDNSGIAVAAGDINGDGIPDLIIGASGASGTAGKTYVIFGSQDTTVWSAGNLTLINFIDGKKGFMLQGEAPGDNSGCSVAAKDINGDGIADLMVGAQHATPAGRPSAGKLYVVFGSNSTTWGNGTLNLTNFTDGNYGFVLQGDATGDNSGNSVNAGDINGDNISDVIVGALQADPLGKANAGKTYAIFGSSSSTAWNGGVFNFSDLTNGLRGFVLQGDAAGDLSGNSISAAADVNGDGISDMIVGAPGASPSGQSSAGKGYIVFGSPNRTTWDNGILNLADFADGKRGFVLQGEAATDNVGQSVSMVSDFNGDGTSDFIIGAFGATHEGLSFSGKSYLIFGSPNHMAWKNGVLNLSDFKDGQHGFVLQGEATGDFSGNAVIAADVNDDGLSDVIIGAYYADASGQLNTGKTYVVLGTDFLVDFSANYLPIFSGEIVEITSQLLAIVSHSPGLNINELCITIENPENGYFSFTFAPKISLFTFYMKNISDGIVQFVHLGGNALAPSYRVIVNSTQSIVTIYSDAQVTFFGYPPNLVNNKLAVNQGMTMLVQSTDLSASDQDDGVLGLVFIISNLSHGQFVIYNSTTNTSTCINSFSQGEVLKRDVWFIHDGSRNVPGYAVAVTDGKSTPPSQMASITFNYAPQLTLAPLLVIDQGKSTTFSQQYISATDAETFADALIIYVKNVSQGYFCYTSNPNNDSIVGFQQSFLATGGIQFVHNGNVTPTFMFLAFDGTMNSSWYTPKVYLNHHPLLQGSVSNQEVIQGNDFAFDLPPGLFRDPDNDTLTYSAALAGNIPLLVGLKFTPPGHFFGNLASVESANIQITASDPRNLTASTSFILSSQQSDAAYYRSVYSTLSGVGGTVLGIIAYLWLRRRIAMHRREYHFSNTLRKVLNLQYYDFMRFEGESYKTKTDNFIQQLQKDHDQFYDRLIPEEKNSFAVCVAGILINRMLVTPSECPDALFGILCCLNVGRPNKLNLEEFKKQQSDIARTAIAQWKEVAVYYKFSPMSNFKEVKEDKDNQENEDNTIYYETKDNELFHYIVFHKNDKNYDGTITSAQLDRGKLPETIEEIKPRLLAILKTRGHTPRSDNAVTEWPYHSPSMEEKLKVFFCLNAKPSSLGMFSENKKRMGNELKDLKTEKPNSDNFAERLTLLENRVHDMQKSRPAV